MHIDRQFFNTSFDIDLLPDWICPSCLKGILFRTETSIKIIESAASKAMENPWTHNADDRYGVFIGILTCNNGKCGDRIVFSGTYNVEMEPNYEEDDMVAVNKIIPNYFSPPLYILPYKDFIPKEVEGALKKAYHLFWIDNSACANAIRKIVEVIMDYHGIAKTYIHKKKNKRERFSLHQRITVFKEKKAEVAEMLEAIKWIGNEGSHAIEVLSRDNILDAFDILDISLNELYNKRSNTILKTVKSINKSKGVRLPVKNKKLK